MKSHWAINFIVFLAFATVDANACEHWVIFLPQLHDRQVWVGQQSTPKELDLIAASQLKVANFIERHPNVPIFSEQMAARDFSVEMIPSQKLSEIRQRYDGQIFPDGLPMRPDSLNVAQKRKLIDNGAEFVQMIRGRVPIVRGVVKDEQTLNEIFGPIRRWFATKGPDAMSAPYPSEIGRLVYGAREREALSQVKKYFDRNRAQKEVILIFGSAHNFNFYPEVFPPECVVIPPEFLADWNGRFRSGPEGFSVPTSRGYNSRSGEAAH